MTTDMCRLSPTNTHNPSLMPSLNITDLFNNSIWAYSEAETPYHSLTSIHPTV